jgi:hypothetical protein
VKTRECHESGARVSPDASFTQVTWALGPAVPMLAGICLTFIPIRLYRIHSGHMNLTSSHRSMLAHRWLFHNWG